MGVGRELFELIFKRGGRQAGRAVDDAAEALIKKGQLAQRAKELDALVEKGDKDEIAKFLAGLSREERAALTGTEKAGYFNSIGEARRTGGPLNAALQAVVGIPAIGKVLFGFVLAYEAAIHLPQILSPAAAVRQEAAATLYKNGQIGWWQYQWDYLWAGFGSVPKPSIPGGAPALSQIDPNSPQSVNSYLAQVQAQNGLQITGNETPAQLAAKTKALENLATTQISAQTELATLPLTQAIRNEMDIRQQLFALTNDPRTLSGYRPRATPTDIAMIKNAHPGLFDSLSPEQWEQLLPNETQSYADQRASVQTFTDAIASPHNAAVIIAKKLQTGPAEGTANVYEGQFSGGAFKAVYEINNRAQYQMRLAVGDASKRAGSAIQFHEIDPTSNAPMDMRYGLSLGQYWNLKKVGDPPSHVSVQEHAELADAIRKPSVRISAGATITPFRYANRSGTPWTTGENGEILVPVQIRENGRVRTGFISEADYNSLGFPALDKTFYTDPDDDKVLHPTTNRTSSATSATSTQASTTTRPPATPDGADRTQVSSTGGSGPTGQPAASQVGLTQLASADTGSLPPPGGSSGSGNPLAELIGIPSANAATPDGPTTGESGSGWGPMLGGLTLYGGSAWCLERAGALGGGLVRGGLKRTGLLSLAMAAGVLLTGGSAEAAVNKGVDAIPFVTAGKEIVLNGDVVGGLTDGAKELGVMLAVPRIFALGANLIGFGSAGASATAVAGTAAAGEAALAVSATGAAVTTAAVAGEAAVAGAAVAGTAVAAAGTSAGTAAATAGGAAAGTAVVAAAGEAIAFTAAAIAAAPVTAIVVGVVAVAALGYLAYCWWNSSSSSQPAAAPSRPGFQAASRPALVA